MGAASLVFLCSVRVPQCYNEAGKKELTTEKPDKVDILSPPLSIFVTFIWFVKNRPTADTEHFEN